MLSAMNEIAILQKVQHPRVVSVQVGPPRAQWDGNRGSAGRRPRYSVGTTVVPNPASFDVTLPRAGRWALTRGRADCTVG